MNPLAQQYHGELWAMEPSAMRAFISGVEALTDADLKAAGLKAFSVASPPLRSLDVQSGVAVIQIRGVMMRRVPAILQLFGVNATSIDDVSAQITEAVADDGVSRIHLEIDSPGGSVAGVQDLADTVAAAGESKKVTAHTSGAMASAALWVGSQAGRITATASALVGSIGVFTSVNDYSGEFAKAGIEVNVLSSAHLKGAGVIGAPVSKEQLASIQSTVDGMAALFSAAVESGRKMTSAQVDKVATGQVWLAAEALKLGLIDAVGNAEQAPAAEEEVEEQDQPDQDDPQQAAVAAEDTTMADVANGAATAQAEAEKVKIEAQAKIEAANKKTRDVMAAQYATRISAENRASIEEYGAFCVDDFDKFEAHLKALPAIGNPTPVGETQERDVESDVAPEPPSAGEVAVAKLLNTSVACIDALDDVDAVTLDGKAVKCNGEIVAASEVL